MRQGPHLLPTPSSATAQAPNKFCNSDCRAVRSVSSALGTPHTIKKAVARGDGPARIFSGPPPHRRAWGPRTLPRLPWLRARAPGRRTPSPSCARAPALPPRACETPLTALQSTSQNLRPIGLERNSLLAIVRDYVARASLTLIYFSAVLPLPSPARLGLRWTFAASLYPSLQPFA